MRTQIRSAARTGGRVVTSSVKKLFYFMLAVAVVAALTAASLTIAVARHI